MNGIKACTPGEEHSHLREFVGLCVENMDFGTRFDTVDQCRKIRQIAGNENNFVQWRKIFKGNDAWIG